MTNLQRLISVISMTPEIEQEVILAFFGDQDKYEYVIDGNTYVLLTERVIEDKLYDQYEEEFYDFSEYLEDFGGYNYSLFLDESSLIQQRVNLFNYKDLKEYDFIAQVDDLYIYEL